MRDLFFPPFLFYKKQQCPINFDRQLGISHFKIQHGIKLCITSLSTFFLSRDEHFARFFNNMPRALSVSLFSSAWLCQYFPTTPLRVTLPITASLAPPLQLDKVNTHSVQPGGTCSYQQSRFTALMNKLCLFNASLPQLGLFLLYRGNLSPAQQMEVIT